MSSSVHFKFKSQKEPSRVTFDGTGISVFELKREIINQSRLGDGTDFELSIYNEDTREEYDDDTTIIPRSTSVIARRLPASRPGKGGATRYVSGKMPINARNASRNDQVSSSRTMPNPTNTVSNGVLELNNAQTEEEKINALFNLQANQWKEQQQEMANATPVPLGRGRGKPINVPDHPPPPGYLCYRCREKGHWIQACPTNNDPKFDGKYRVKRSTGIPRSLQTKVEKPESLTIDGSNEDLKNTGVMVNADGDFVIAKPDKAAWELYQEKAKASAAAAAEAAAAEYSKELQARGLECPIDKRMFLEPTKTPCCQRTYCNDCITNALIESDFVCPGCGTEGVLLDNLSADDDAVIKIKAYETEKVDSKKEKEKHSAAQENQSTNKPYASTGDSSRKAELSSPASPRAGLSKYSKKRPAEDGPLGEATEGSNQTSTQKKQKAEDNPKSIETSPSQVNDASSGFQPLPFGQQMHFGGFNFMQAQGIPSMAFPDAGFAGEGTGFMNSAGLASSNAFTANISQTWNPMGGMNFNALSNGLYGDSTNGAVNSGYGATNMFNGMGDSQMNMFPIAHMAGGMQQSLGFPQGPSMGHFSNQQRTTFSTPYAREEDTAYFRQPVNPQRHQARYRRIRPSDYREL
ncbi:DWNN domain-containing protein [Aspergillus pseudonomiae]|uniref:DWNN domain-containing protein n=1 Tax=Aspergillus pseudonomiae TaxID=1506151 RepID=A0A5N6IAX6_9EURO|nr:DWNN domain-containing protein [Aspergillus pseudonomiae]KAB8263735.1 DWNN domain-containing protein [Aspergillus pseudonomiae]KAE8400428.1 DWNN domain-containing protein [Aspergillus pseudonomiae]